MKKYYPIAAALLVAICIIDLSIGGEGIIGLLKQKKPLQNTTGVVEDKPPAPVPASSPPHDVDAPQFPDEPRPVPDGESQAMLRPLPPPSQEWQTDDANVAAAADRMMSSQHDLVAMRARKADIESSLPRVKRIFSCDERPAAEDIVKGLNGIQKFLPQAYCDDRCDFQPVEDYVLPEQGRCSLRNSLAYTPSQIKATYPKNLLRTYVDKLHDLRVQNDDWKSFSDVSEDLRNRLKEYMWVNRCSDVKIGIANTTFTQTVNACDEPYYTMVRSSRNLDGVTWTQGHKFDSYFWKLLDLEELKNGDFLVADYTDLRFYPPKVNFYLLKKDDLSLELLKGDTLDPLTRTVEQTSDFAGDLHFDRETNKMEMGGGNPHTGMFWGAKYHLEANRIILDEVQAMTGAGEMKTVYTRAGGVDRSALGEQGGNRKTYEEWRRNPESIKGYTEHQPELTAARKKELLGILGGVKDGPAPP